METVKKNDFVGLRFTGYANGTMFDSNEEEQIKKLNPEAEAKEITVVIGRGMVVPGLDKALEGKELGKQYEVMVSAKEGFGERQREMVKTIPLKIFTEKNVNPYPGMVLSLDNMIARIVTVSGARVVTDFNNPMAGKNLKYAFTITRKVDNEEEKARALFEVSFKGVPEFEINEKIIVKGPKILESYAKAFSPMFKELIGKEIGFELKLPPSNLKKEEGKDEGHEHGEGHYHADGTYHAHAH